MLRFAPLPYVTPSAPVLSLGQLAQPAIIKDESREALRYKTLAMFATGASALVAGWESYERFQEKGAKSRTKAYISGGFGALSAVLFLVLMFEPKA